MVCFKINKLPPVHIVDRYLETLSEFNVQNDYKGLDFFIPEDKEYDFSRLPESFRGGYAAFVIGGTYFTKKIPAEKIIEICNKAGIPVILLGGKAESDTGEKVLSESNGNILDLSGKISLYQSASVVEHARIVLTGDTGLMHIAAAFRKKIISFWGNTIPEFGMYPYMADPASKIMEVKNLKCRPCSKLGYKQCPKGHFKCMRQLDANEVADWISQNFFLDDK